ncbi:hypothetical protein SynA1840_01224 [Synechococcus sp. A18-40]|nr:hypothetical protein SynA1840_01224 [Synechococcus sp. A18-40]
MTGLKSFSQILGAFAVSGFQDQSHKPLDHLSRVSAPEPSDAVQL